ncbi:hypothetical protein [Aurantimonas sp. VKM B-3413]|uniref:hypothetical protein n=1 Tax=Aurantimonas sp. VKM B-3413 TaxID=2779401 RepID=UPI001E391BE0|nr:hypothetical protein [Aurantimonas sp. VKM B-3413]MCB8836707.1 hypothetical protein [Aurantimonas sp. VKM B-3413]
MFERWKRRLILATALAVVTVAGPAASDQVTPPRSLQGLLREAPPGKRPAAQAEKPSDADILVFDSNGRELDPASSGVAGTMKRLKELSDLLRSMQNGR